MSGGGATARVRTHVTRARTQTPTRHAAASVARTTFNPRTCRRRQKSQTGRDRDVTSTIRRPATSDDEPSSSSSSSAATQDALSDGLDPALEMAIPPDQRPVNELRRLKEDPLMAWALLESGELATRLFVLLGGVMTMVGMPIASFTYAPGEMPVRFFLASLAGGCFATALATLRVYLGWSYVGSRLLTATLEYEESGWYDGQMWAKPPEILARDRLLGLYEVNPALKRVKSSLTTCGLGVFACAASLVVLGKTSDTQPVGAPRLIDGQVVFRQSKNDGTDASMADVMDDDEEAEAEAQAVLAMIGRKPAYCADDLSRAVAGGNSDACFDR